MTVTIILLLFRVQLDHGVDTHDRDACFDSTLQLADLAHAGFQYAGLEAVVDTALHQVEAVVLIRLLLGNGFFGLVGVAFLDALGHGVTGSQLGDQFGGVFGCVDGQCLGDDEKGLREFANGELFAGALS